jgi:hypothetical protein
MLSPQPGADGAAGPAGEDGAEGGEASLDRLADEVYHLLRWRLAAERERAIV